MEEGTAARLTQAVAIGSTAFLEKLRRQVGFSGESLFQIRILPPPLRNNSRKRLIGNKMPTIFSTAPQVNVICVSCCQSIGCDTRISTYGSSLKNCCGCSDLGLLGFAEFR